MLKMNVVDDCVSCGLERILSVPPVDYALWCAGMPAQQAFPTLSASEREFLISSICPDCWDEMFGGAS